MTTHWSMEPQEEDAAVQEAILYHVLDEHPGLLSQSDLIREIPSGPDELSSRDNVERAIDELIKRGLLDRLGGYVLPTRAAVHSRLLSGL